MTRLNNLGKLSFKNDPGHIAENKILKNLFSKNIPDHEILENLGFFLTSYMGFFLTPYITVVFSTFNMSFSTLRTFSEQDLEQSKGSHHGSLQTNLLNTSLSSHRCIV